MGRAIYIPLLTNKPQSIKSAKAMEPSLLWSRDYFEQPESVVYAGPNSFACGHSNGDEKHGDKEQGDGKADFVNGNVT